VEGNKGQATAAFTKKTTKQEKQQKKTQNNPNKQQTRGALSHYHSLELFCLSLSLDFNFFLAAVGSKALTPSALLIA
jgi:hypothetical protein